MYNNLIDSLTDDEILEIIQKGKKDALILKHKDKVITILTEGKSLRNQLLELTIIDKKFNNISLATYAKYLKKYLGKSYNIYLNKSLFTRDKFLAIEIICNEKIFRTSEVYKVMCQRGLLRYTNAGTPRYCDYEYFREKIVERFKDKDINIISDELEFKKVIL